MQGRLLGKGVGTICVCSSQANVTAYPASAQELVDEFQKQSNSGAKLATIEDMQNFVEGFSEFSAAQRNAGKHVTLITELSRHVDSRNLMQVSSVSADAAQPLFRALSTSCRP